MSNFDFSNEGKPVGSGKLIVSTLLALNLVAMVFIAAALWRGVGDDNSPVPPVTENVVAAMADAEVMRLEMEAQASEEIAKKIKSGEIKNSNQLYQWAKAYQDKIDEQAYAEINKLNQKYLVESDRGWSPEQIANIEKFQADKAEGKRKVAK